jgi:hypothetical protein
MTLAAELASQEIAAPQWVGIVIAVPSGLFIIWACFKDQWAALWRKIFWKRDPRRKR